MQQHEIYIKRCFELAQKGMGYVSSNPMVGAVLVHENKIIGEGYHQQFGQAHAEVNCIHAVKEKQLIPQSTLYVSLEPCSHIGKTPPCANFIVEQKIKKVVVACRDFTHKVNGKGITFLQENGVEVIEGILEKEAIELNKRFFTFHQKKRPYIILKWAESMDGFIAKKNEQTSISNTEVNTLVHQWRHEEDAIWIGYNTALIDNPTLNTRHIKGNNPIRIVYDKSLSLPPTLYLFTTQQPTILFNEIENIQDNIVEKIKVNDSYFFNEILETLYQKNILSVIIEGGSKLLQHFIDENIFDEIRCIKSSIYIQQGVNSPTIKNAVLLYEKNIHSNKISFYKNTLHI